MRPQKLTSTRAATRRSTAAGSESEMLDLSEHFVVEGEDPKQFEVLRVELEAEFNPQLAEERELVIRAAGQFWRLRRAGNFESAVIEGYRAERTQTDSEYTKRFNEAFSQARAEAELVKWPFEKFSSRQKKPVDAVPPEAENTEPTPKMIERPREKDLVKFDLSFVGEPSFQDALCKWARYETQLTEELDRTLRLLPRNRTRTERRANSGAYKPTISSDRIVLRGEDAKQFERMSLEFERQYEPQTAVERELVERLVGLTWRLRRVPAFVAAVLEAARAAFKPAIRSGAQWAVDRPEYIFGYSFKDGKLVELTATEREAEWKKLSAWQEGVDKRTREILGDEGREDVFADLGYLRQPDIQHKLAKLARFERALTRQFACTRKLLHFLQTCRLAAEDGSPVRRKSNSR